MDEGKFSWVDQRKSNCRDVALWREHSLRTNQKMLRSRRFSDQKQLISCRYDRSDLGSKLGQA